MRFFGLSTATTASWSRTSSLISLGSSSRLAAVPRNGHHLYYSSTTTMAMANSGMDMPINKEIRHPDEKFPHLLRPTPLIISYNNEDAAVELSLIDYLTKKKGGSSSDTGAPGLRVLLVTGGADNFLSVLAHPSVSHVTSVDQNPFQQALGHLKLALACSDLTQREILTFMGTYDNPIEGMNRIEIYETQLKPNLPADVAALIDEQLMLEIEHGYNVFCSLDNSNRHVNKILETKGGFQMKDLWDGSVDMDALKSFCDRATEHLPVEDYLYASGLLGKLPPPLEKVFFDKLGNGGLNDTLNGHYKIAHTGTRNHIAAMTLFHQYTDDAMPDWLARLEDIRGPLRAKKENGQLKLLTCPILDALDDDTEGNKFDLISPSNIFDWGPVEKRSSDIQTIADHCLSKDGGLMMLRLFFGGASAIMEACKESLEVNPDISIEELELIETGPFFHKTEDGLAVIQHKQN